MSKIDKLIENGIKSLMIENLEEKAVSKNQQQFMGMVHAYKKGEMKDAPASVKKAAKGMTKKAAKDFASTKHKGLPTRVDESVISDILIIADENNTYEKFTAELIKQKYIMPDELEDPETEKELRAMYDGVKDGSFINEAVLRESLEDGYMLNRLTDSQLGNGPASEFLSKHNIDLKALAKAKMQGVITAYEIRDVVKGTAPQSTIKKFMKDYAAKSINEDTSDVMRWVQNLKYWYNKSLNAPDVRNTPGGQEMFKAEVKKWLTSTLNEALAPTNDLKSKMPDHVKGWAKWVAQHANGEWWYYDSIPRLVPGTGWKNNDRDGYQFGSGIKTAPQGWEKSSQELKENKMNAKTESIVKRLKEDTEYQKFFKSAMDKFGVKSPKELSDKKKKEFFNYVDKNYKAKSE